MALQQSQEQTLGPSTYTEAVTEFTCSLYKEVCGGASSNAFMSPYSVSAALMLAMLGTEGACKLQIMEALNLNDLPTQNVHADYKKLHDALNSSMNPSTVLAIANRVFAKIGLNVKGTYTSNSKSYYGGETELMDFGSDPEGSRRRINTWVEDQTNKKIKDLIPSGSIDGLTLVILVNAIYFKGEWDTQFKKGMTVKKDFHVNDTFTKKTDMMHSKKENFRCGDFKKFDCKALELPYKGQKMSMLLLLPNKVRGVAALEKHLSLSTINEISRGMRRRDALVIMPKFKIEMTAQLQSILPKLGIRDLFSPKDADLSAMLENPPPDTYVSDVIHKAFIEVNEEGTEAAAATGMMIRALCIPPPPFEFTADHPFLFLIKDNKSGTVLFIGRYSQPTEA